MKTSKPPLDVFLLVLLAVSGPTGAEETSDWPEHRGPTGDGAGTSAVLETGEPVGLEVLWRRELGTGYSGIVVSGGVGATLYGNGEDDLLIVFDAPSGETLWERSLDPTYRGHHGSDDGPISTPAIADSVVYALSPRGRLVACRLEDGELLWERRLEVGGEPEYGFASSPRVVGEMLVIQAPGTSGSSLVAFRRRDGAEVWSAGDSTAAYESATVASIRGVLQIVAADRQWLFGVTPDTGRPLWRLEHGLGHEIGLAQPLVHRDSEVLINSLDGAASFEVHRDGGWRSAELWRSNDLKRSYTVPVIHEDHAYGFSGSFLVALNLADGRAVWRSRAPGGGNLTLISGHVAVLARDGRLVLAPAAPDGFREVAAAQVLQSGGVTAPSYADSTFFVRDLEEMAAVRLVAGASAPSDTARAREAIEARGEMRRLLEMLEESSDPVRVVDAFMSEQLEFPIFESGGLVHFVFRGPAEDVALKGSVVAFDPSGEAHLPLRRAPGTDFWFVSVEKDPKGHWEYVFEVDGTQLTDPLNPHTVGSIFGPASELRMPQWRSPAHIEPAAGRTGRIESVPFASSIRGDERELRVYLPPGYDDGTADYRLLLVNNGHLALDEGRFDHTLDNLVGTRVEPLVAVFLPRSRDELGGPKVADYTRMLADELVPFLESRYRLRAGAPHRAIAGVGSGGTAAAHTAIHRADVFGRLAIQSAYFPSSDLAAELLSADRDLGELSAYVEWSRYDVRIERLGVDAIEDGRRLADALEAAGANVRRNVVDGAPGWASWRAQNDEILEWLFPLPNGTNDEPAHRDPRGGDLEPRTTSPTSLP